ncbi:sigma-70 family RNA polymerase sigma factor [Xanthomonas vasicola]|nr:sigma-70 family RNA polymerase sigma factor [Xanthomonas vasicola]AZR30478.1 sigma-70 family RNA polymerase sigma factor [Xanthomonas vasicola pv. musacearum NCPPB 4379]AZR35476.1 sigma-70 family RNA polymerase sigma factor [Xanthomonas vasicola]MBV6742035.1 sigma-70 family RNA polymerase sigma factor [Xanthomonas vasicola pv. musacearum NCPPB 2251]MBV7278391.1 sigma-70 family RNA polymerase sigma factor [Xanthomonas vasicola pv. musacearum]MBV7289476.1 sigma-70 family RNA polymerase sigma 
MGTYLQARFSTLLQQHRCIVLKVAASYCHDRDERAELAQEIATHLWRAFSSYDPSRRFSTWIYRIALNVAISDLRGRRHMPGEPIALDAAVERIADPLAHDPVREQRVAALYAFITQQPPLERALLLLYPDEHNYREIGQVLGISQTNVATKLSRLKTRMRAEL